MYSLLLQRSTSLLEIQLTSYINTVVTYVYIPSAIRHSYNCIPYKSIAYLRTLEGLREPGGYGIRVPIRLIVGWL